MSEYRTIVNPHIYYRCHGCGGENYREKAIREHVQNCPKGDGRYLKVSEEVMQVEEKEAS